MWEELQLSGHYVNELNRKGKGILYRGVEMGASVRGVLPKFKNGASCPKTNKNERKNQTLTRKRRNDDVKGRVGLLE